MGAEKYWDRLWESGRWDTQWSRPDPWVIQQVASLDAGSPIRALDLGCGVGRHALALAARGAVAVGVDASAAALANAKTKGEEDGLAATFAASDCARLPFEDGLFDYALAYNVVYHGNEETLRGTLDEIHRVLRPNGTYQTTMLSKHNREYGCGREVSHNTFVQPDAFDDKVHEHLYLNREEVLAMHGRFVPIELVESEHEKPGSYYFHCVFTSSDRPSAPV